MKEQAKRMHAAWKNQSPAERSRKKRERQQQEQQQKNELHEMVMHEVQQSMKDMFKTHHHQESDDDSDMQEAHQTESLNLADVKVSECYNLSDLRQPPTKRIKTQHFAPITTALLETRLGKSRLHKIRVLFDSGSSGSIIVGNFVKKLRVKKDKKTEWLTKGGTFPHLWEV